MFVAPLFPGENGVTWQLWQDESSLGGNKSVEAEMKYQSNADVSPDKT